MSFGRHFCTILALLCTIVINSMKKLIIKSKYAINYTIQSNFSLDTEYYTASLNYLQKKSSKNILPTIKAAIITPFGIKTGIFLLDSGSTTSLLNSEFANNLRVKGIESSITVNGINAKKQNDESRIVKLKMSRLEDTNNTTFVAFHTFDDLQMGNQTCVAQEFHNRYKHLKHLQLPDFSKADGLIGIDNMHIFDWQIIKSKNKMTYSPLGIRTAIGDCVIHCTDQLIEVYNKCTENLDDQEQFLPILRNKNEQTLSISCTFAINDMECSLSQESNLLDHYEDEYLKIEELIHLQNCKHFDNDSRDNYYDHLASETLEKETILLQESNHFQAPILWKDKENLDLPTEASYKNALRRFLIIERYGKKKKEFEEYEKEVKNLLDKKYATVMTDDEIITRSRFSYYVATFFIKPENKRRRMIFDFKSKVNGKSYNSHVIGSLNLLNRIDTILHKARKGKFIIKGDIGEMFHQIYLSESDADSMRFLFRFDSEEEIKHYRLKVLPFGCASSPTISQFVKNKIAKSAKDSNPLVYEALTFETYMDDTITSLSCEKTIINLAVDIKMILWKNGFNMLKIKSNSRNIDEVLKDRLKDVTEEKLFSKESKERLLGYEFNMENDMISPIFSLESLPTNIRNNLNHPTKRNVLQIMNSLFDPLGLFGYITAKMKIVYKKVCETQDKWDEKIHNDIVPLWQVCLRYYSEASKIEIPRWINPLEVDKKDLLIFCDASTEMTCTVAYSFSKNTERNESNLCLISSKSHTINKRRKYTIPELELEAAHQAVKLKLYLDKTLKENFENTLFFTDSHIVLNEIQLTKHEKFSVFTHNRIKIIHEHTDKNSWYWVPTSYQPADYGTKIEAEIENNSTNQWFKPKLLELNYEEWTRFTPKSSLVYSIINVPNNDNATPINEFITTSKYKNFQQLIRISCVILKYKYRRDTNLKKLENEVNELKNSKKRENNARIKFLQEIISEIKDFSENDSHWHEIAEAHWLRRAQEEDKDLKTIIQRLKSNKDIPSRNKYQKLLLYIDEIGLLRLRTRISEEVAEKYGIHRDRANPIILPQDSSITKLIILQEHASVGHALTKSCANKIRTRFYLKSIEKQIEKTIKNECHFCIRNNKIIRNPLMGDIPAYAFAFKENSFTKIVCDVFGPVEIKPSRYSKTVVKRWVLVGVCLGSRGIHMEILENQTTEAYFRAFEMMFCIRGRPKIIITDQFSSFLATNKTINELAKECNEKLMNEGVISTPIEWIAKSAHMPWQQGVVERQIQEIKKLFKNFRKTLNLKDTLLENDLRYILMKITNILNNSPITSYEEGVLIPQLTPNHFLMSRQNSQALPLQNIYTKNLRSNWNEHKKLINSFWNRWLETFFMNMLIREKWTRRIENVKMDDIILTADKNTSDSWRLGRVIAIDNGSNNQIRAVTIRLGKNCKIENHKKLTSSEILKTYRNEKFVIVTRPVATIAVLKVKPMSL